MASLEKAITRDAYKWVNSLARNAAKEIMNAVADAGPEWSGNFKNSWVADTPAGGTSSGSFPYNLADVPVLPATRREVERRVKYIIGNTASYAGIAMDLDVVPREEFIYPGYPPQGDVVARGKRPEKGKRGDLSAGSGNATSTAPLDWFTTFVGGGKMQKALERGVRLTKP